MFRYDQKLPVWRVSDLSVKLSAIQTLLSKLLAASLELVVRDNVIIYASRDSCLNAYRQSVTALEYALLRGSLEEWLNLVVSSLSNLSN